MNKRIYPVLVSFLLISTHAFAAGTLKGSVIFEGTPPAVEAVEVKSDAPVCGLHKETSAILLAANKGVKNAVVRIVGLKNTTPSDGHLDQIECEFQPHVQVMSVASNLVVTSSDSVLHNAHGFYEDGKTAFNLAVPVVGIEIKKQLNKPGVIRLRCDAGHTWMKGFIYVTEDRAVVTDADGNFSFSDLPAGQYELEVWQEWTGKMSTSVTIKDGENLPLSITLKAPGA